MKHIFRLDDEEFEDLPVILSVKHGKVKVIDCHKTNLPGVAIVHAASESMNPFMPYVFYLANSGYYTLIIFEMWNIRATKHVGTDAETAIIMTLHEAKKICMERLDVSEDETAKILAAMSEVLKSHHR